MDRYKYKYILVHLIPKKCMYELNLYDRVYNI